MSRRANHHLQHINNVTSLKTNELLTDIKANTASVNLNTDTLESKLTDGTQKSQILGNTAGDGTGDSKHLLTDTDGRLQVDLIDGGTPLKTFTYQTDPSELLTSGQSVDRHFVVIGGCDQINGNFDEINPLQVDANGKITISNIALAQATQTPADTAYKQKVFLGLHDVSGAVIRTAQSDASGNLKVSTDKITQGYDATISSGGDGLFQSLVYGRDSSGNLDALNVDNNGHLKIAVDTVENKGTQGNIQNATLNFGSTSSSVDVSDFNHANILYEDSNTSSFDDPVLEVSVDNTNFYKSFTSISPVVRGSKREGVIDIKLHGIKYVRIKNESVADNFTSCVCTVVGTPN
jgi:hypothetical protein